MKEFSALAGGRYTYADDLENLQELALAFTEIFDDCDNFIISGCQVSGNTISSGYVYLNGKLRYFTGVSGVSSWPQYIYELNSTESVLYESGGAKIGRNIYGCALAKSVPAQPDPLTNKVPASLVVQETGGLRLKDAFLGKYALLLNPSGGVQTVNSAVNFSRGIVTNGDLTVNKAITIKNGTIDTTISHDGSVFNITSTGNGNTYKMSIEDELGTRFYANGDLLMTIGSQSIDFAKPVTFSQGTIGGLVLSENHIYQGTSNAQTDLYINYYGYAGETNWYRNTHIGNGRGKNIISVTGSTGMVNIDGKTVINNGSLDGLTLKASSSRANFALINAISWKDSSGVAMARIGYTATSDQNFSIVSLLNNIQITGTTYVNIGPMIKENGVLLSERYAMSSDVKAALKDKVDKNEVYTIQESNSRFAVKREALSQFITDLVTAEDCRKQIGAVGQNDLTSQIGAALKDKADKNEVYTIQESDAKFVIKNGGLSQFVTESVTASDCRDQIGAVGQSDLELLVKRDMFLSDMVNDESDKKKIRDNIGALSQTDLQTYAKLDMFLSDMVATEEDKKKIRDNIGASGIGDYEPKQDDSGWILIKDSLYIRQIGKIVSIQGSTKTIHSGTVFTIPNIIAPPSKAIKHTIGFANNRTWVCKIDANQRACTVVYCDASCNRETEFSITYMI